MRTVCEGTTSLPSRRQACVSSPVPSGLAIPTLDSSELFAAAVRRDGSSRYFLGDRDIHFTPEGHRLLGEWLATRLPIPRPPSHSEPRTAAPRGRVGGWECPGLPRGAPLSGRVALAASARISPRRAARRAAGAAATTAPAAPQVVTAASARA